MRVRFVALAIIVLLLTSATAALGSGLPWKADFPPADRPPGTAGHTVMTVPPVATSPFGGFSSVDFLGQVRRQLDLGHLISLFPFSWSGSAATEVPAGRVQFLGFSYERVNASPLEGSFYYTGEQYEGKRVYVAATDKKPDGVPDHIFLGDGGHFLAYAIAGRPAVYAYLPYGTFNTNETVRLGVANDGPGSVDLPNAAPYVIRRNESGAWRTIYSPVAAQVITRLDKGRRLAWQWDQRLNDGTLVPFGDYQVMIADKYSVPFRIAGNVPVVEASDASVDRAGADELAASSPALEAFGKAYPDPSASTKEDIVSIMLYKAWALGLDPEQLRKAIEAAGDGLPCMAIHASYEGRPAWIVLHSPTSGSSASGIYIIDDATGHIV
jgi:hypothetical protein